MTSTGRRRMRIVRWLRLWSRRVKLGRKLAYSLAAAGVVAGILTVMTMTGAKVLEMNPQTIVALLYLDVILLLLLGVVVITRLVAVWVDRRRGLAGSGLHVRLVVLFSLVAVTPAILVAVFAALFLNFGIQGWFNEKVRTALDASQAVAVAYLHEHRQNIRADVFAVANDLDRNASALMGNSGRFNQFLSAQASLRSLPEALVIDSNGRVLARSELSLSLEFALGNLPPKMVRLADQGEIVILTKEKDERVRAMIKLNRFVDAYLLVGRFVDPRVLEHIQRTEGAVTVYKHLQESSEGIQITFVMIFVVVALLLLFAAVWVGLTLATQLAHPISNLISAAERVRKGDLDVRVQSPAKGAEIGTLSRAFNRMTSQLATQQQGLLDANRELDARRRFTETVLSGVSAGVIGLDNEGCINLPNRSASELLATDLQQSIGRSLSEVVPEMADLIETALRRPDRMHQAQIKLVRKGSFHTLLVRVAAEHLATDIIGYVVTFDDVTELLSAQRKAAWADVARRIAHEIKNPLTPIQLSAERLKRKYLKEIATDPEIFAACTDTIVRQVADIGHMVDEFSSFARMPQPTLKLENLSEICRQAVFLERNRCPDITFDVDLPEHDTMLRCDRHQIAQALTNLLKNATESIGDNPQHADKTGQPGHVRITISMEPMDEGMGVTVTVEDNGKGLPREQRDQLTEPYVTTRTKGTGLGLAIVKKIMEDHNGRLVLEDREEGGARVSLAFQPLDDAGNDTGSGFFLLRMNPSSPVTNLLAKVLLPAAATNRMP